MRNYWINFSDRTRRVLKETECPYVRLWVHLYFEKINRRKSFDLWERQDNHILILNIFDLILACQLWKWLSMLSRLLYQGKSKKMCTLDKKVLKKKFADYLICIRLISRFKEKKYPI